MVWVGSLRPYINVIVKPELTSGGFLCDLQALLSPDANHLSCRCLASTSAAHHAGNGAINESTEGGHTDDFGS